MRMARDLLQPDGQSPVEARSSLTFSNMKAKSLQLECAYVEDEIKHLLHISDSSSWSSSEDCGTLEIPSRTSELSTTRSVKEDKGTNRSIDKEERRGSRRRQRKGCSPIRSILNRAAQDSYHDEDGCTAAWDRLESGTKESHCGRCMRNATAKKKCALSRFQVPPLDILSNKSTCAEIPSSFNMQCASRPYDNGNSGELRVHDDEQLPRNKKKKKRELASDALPPQESWELDKRQTEREEIAKCQRDILKMFQGLKANMGYLLDLEARSQCKL